MKAAAFDSDDDGEEDDEQVQEALGDLIDQHSIQEDGSFPKSDDETSGCTKRKRDDNDELDERVKNDGEEDGEEEYDDEGRKTRKKTKVVDVRKNSDDNDDNQPGELEQADFHDEILITDVPERMQHRDYPITPVEEGSTELDNESYWIYVLAFISKGPQTVEKIRRVLEFIRHQNFEVPFIACYRKEHVQPELSMIDLWIIYELDGKWMKFQNLKKKVMGISEELKKYQLQNNPENVRVLKDKDFESLKMVVSIVELSDVHNLLILHYENLLPSIMSTEDEDLKNLRDPGNVDLKLYSDIVKSLNGKNGKLLKECYGLILEELGDNMRGNCQVHGVLQKSSRIPREDAFDVRFESTGAEGKPNFSTSDEVLAAANYMLAVQFATEPSVRRCARESFFRVAHIHVIFTEQSLKEINGNHHHLDSFKFLKEQPVRDLDDDQFLRLVVAEQDGVLSIVFQMKIEGATTSYVDGIKSLFTYDEFSDDEHVKKWNAERQKVIDQAFTKFLLPQLEKELRVKLLNDAQEFVVRACCQQLNNRLKVAPYKANFHDEGDWDPKDGIRIMGLSFNRDKAEVCVIGVDGECSDQIRLEHILRRPNTEKEMMDRRRDLNTLKDFIFRKKPHVIAVSAESREALMLVEDLQTISAQLAEDEEYPPINVELVDNSVAKIIAKSTRVKTQFPRNRLLREAISIARMLQDGLLEIAQLCNADEEIVNVKWHPMQDHVPRKQLLERLHMELVNETNQVGVDVNRAINHPRTAHLIQFICGLGPRKADDLINTLKKNHQKLKDRNELSSVCHMGPKVLINCAGFIKIVSNSPDDGAEPSFEGLEPLDGSRVHPENYDWARQMAVAALKHHGEDADPADAVKKIIEAPERIRDFNLDKAVFEYEHQGHGKIRNTLEDIRSELHHPYKDGRSSYKTPSPLDIFYMVNKETPHTFKIGKLVLATVTGFQHRKPEREELDRVSPIRDQTTGLWQCPYCVQKDFTHRIQVLTHLDAGSCIGQAIGVNIRLENGLLGYLPIKCLSDSEVKHPEELIRLGQHIRCRIAKINAERFSVDVVCKPSDVLDGKGESRQSKGAHYDTPAEVSKAEKDSKKLKHRQSNVPGKSPAVQGTRTAASTVSRPKSLSTYRDNKRSPSRKSRSRSRSPERDRDRSSRRLKSPVQGSSKAASTVSRPKSLSTYRDNKRSPSPKSRRSRSPERERDRSSRRHGSRKHSTHD
ncbi:hypothetical protein DAPPUDRAFT_266300 [Daphnia pulex]|uniref:S1 motif domain-containing protein n=1 Tax=Daphnia pulex TaxID=6669 RepID=E9HUU3_DAPPU|nr:hypothetical protein DAPPUDRAFT_266300 [Daphnia pulex]|eukprot:EFX64484.1 hypothetical protein DAPPUDRAFT_266300 [Daphnia pulex]